VLLCCLALPGVIGAAGAEGSLTTDSAESERKSSDLLLEDARFTRSFYVDPNSLVELISVIGAPLENPQEAIRSFLISRGVRFSDGSNAFYNDRTGIFIARGTPEELDAIETALAELSITPPLVRLHPLLVEISGSSLTPQFKPTLGPFAGQDVLKTTNQTVLAVTGVLTEAQARLLIRALEQRLGVDMWTAPITVTASGHQARLTLEPITYEPVTDPPFTAPGKWSKSRWSKEIVP
jgi:hypothetical protein